MKTDGARHSGDKRKSRDSNGSLSLKVERATSKDLGRGIIRMDPTSMKELSTNIGDVVSIEGKRKTFARCLPSYVLERGQNQISTDELIRKNAQIEIGDDVLVTRVSAEPASSVTLEPLTPNARPLRDSQVSQLLEGLPGSTGDIVRAGNPAMGSADYRIVRTTPDAPVVFTANTAITIQGGREKPVPKKSKRTGYEDVGGLTDQMGRIREMIELPLKCPEVFERLGIDPPKGVLMYGAPGSGKTLIARAIASATDAHFFKINGPEVIQKLYGESEHRLRTIFEEASKKAPTIIFIDEIDAIAPRRAETQGDVEKRVVAQLLALMDGLQSRGQVIVIGATNIPDALDPALRRPGRFDREIMIPAPDRAGRLEILKIHTRSMPMSEDVDLERLATVTHGFVGADLQSLCREAAMTAVRAVIPVSQSGKLEVPMDVLMKLELNMSHFQAALREVEPSAIRDILVEVPDVRFDQIGGLHETKQILKESIDWPIRYPQLFDEAKVDPPKGILLCGPPGTGKTTLAKALARESEANFISIKGPALFSKWVGETEKGVRELFRKARQVAPTIIFIDEIDSLAPRRGNTGADSGVAERATSQLLTELDGLEELRGVVVVAATNRRDMIDAALLRPGRFDLILDLPVPDETARMDILKIHTKGRPLAKDVNLEKLRDAMDGYVGAEIESVVNQACIMAIREYLQTSKGKPEKLEVTDKNFQAALELRNSTKQVDQHDE